MLQVAEEALVRDVLYACQGVNGQFVQYDQDAQQGLGGYVLNAKAGISAAHRPVMLAICELGWLFRCAGYGVKPSLARTGEPGTSQSAIRQALYTAIQQEFAEFYRLMAVLELQASHQQPEAPLPVQQAPAKGGRLTLRRLAVWLAQPMLQMRWLAAMVDSTAEQQGGALVSAVEAFAQHGDPAVHACMLRVLQHICRPLLHMVHGWIFDGRLQDAGGDFFVSKDLDAATGHTLWGRQYQLRRQLIPSFINSQLADVIFKAGKSINFLRCKCSAQQGTASIPQQPPSNWSLLALQRDGWDGLIVTAADSINRHVVSTLLEKYALVKHCDALRRYLLLGQGDFVQSLMDQVGPLLTGNAVEVSEFTLNGSLDAAIRASNAQFDDADTLARLRVRMERAAAHETGWDVFALWYQLDEPLTTVIGSEAMAGYLRLFRLLWVIKRVEHTLSSAWQMMNNMQRQLAGIEALQKETGVQSPVLRLCHKLRIDMAHFCTDLQTYIAFEVLQASWDAFLVDLDQVSDLDGIIETHQRYAPVA
eukprot:jgi/Astpho2/3662/e_gw1.00059.4.1_t